MAISVDWNTKVITVPKTDTTLVQASPEIRELDIDTFRLALKDIEDDEGMPFVDTHSHNAEVTVAGVTLARVVSIINGYTITFEDGQYAVNLVGANSNIADVTNVNQVSVRSANSAGLVSIGTIESRLKEIWQVLGCDPDAELVVDEPETGTPGSYSVDGMSITLTVENGGKRVRFSRS